MDQGSPPDPAGEPHGVGAPEGAERLERSSNAPRRRPTTSDSDAVPPGQADLPGSRRSGAAALADAARRVLHPQPALRVRERRVRPDRLWHERAFRRPHRLARRRVRRDPWNERPWDPAGAGFTRLEPAQERAYPPAGAADAGRNAADGALGATRPTRRAVPAFLTGRGARARRSPRWDRRR